MSVSKLILIIALLLSSRVEAHPSRYGGSAIPSPAAAVGYKTLTFSNNLNFNTSNVDMSLTNASGFNWYFCNFFGGNQSYAKGTTAVNSDGSISALSVPSQLCSLSSAAAIGSSPYFVGTAFGGGGYFEFEASYSPNEPGYPNPIWPSTWMMSLEHLDNDHGDDWTGQPAGYRHFLEVDVMEDIFPNKVKPAIYQSLHDWWGQYNVTCSGWCQTSGSQSNITYTPLGVDVTQYHRYAVLWVPATVSTSGSYTFYYDDVAYLNVPTASFTQYTSQSPPVTNSTPWLFGVGDNLHEVLLIGGGQYPINIKSVHVWQSSSAGNVTN